MAGGPARVSPLFLDSVRVLIGSCPPLFGQTNTPLPQGFIQAIRSPTSPLSEDSTRHVSQPPPVLRPYLHSTPRLSRFTFRMCEIEW